MTTKAPDTKEGSAVRFDTRLLPPEQRFAAWATGMPYYDVSTPNPHAFQAQVCAWSLPPVLIVDARLSAIAVGRDIARIGADGREEIVLLLLMQGSAQGDADGCPFRARSGEIVCHDRARPLAMALSAGRNVAVSIPRAFLEERVRAAGLHGRVLSGDAAALLRAAMAALPQAIDGMRNAAELARVLRDLIAATVRDGCDPDGRDTAQALRARVRRFIDQNLDAPLGIGQLCSALGVSRARLYRAFQDTDGIARYIQSRRLARVHRLLSDPAETRSIGQLALCHGFADPAHFSRLFRRRFGLSAQELRRTSRAGRTTALGGDDAAVRFRIWEAAR
jgi:AraC-like DNA-binding protein